MKPLVDLAQALRVNVGVDLGRGDVGVSQELLDDLEIGAAEKQVCGEGVAEHVGVNVAQARCRCVPADELPDGDAFEWLARAGEQQPTIRADGVAGQERTGGVEIGSDGLTSGLADRYQASLVALARDPDDGQIEVNVIDSEVGQFACASAAGVHEFEQGAVSHHERGAQIIGARRGILTSAGTIGEFRAVGGLDERLDLARAHDLREFLPRSRSVEQLGWVLREQAGGHGPLEERPDCGEVSDDRGGGHALGGPERSEMIGQVSRRHISDRDSARIVQRNKQVLAVALVRRDGVVREAALNPCVGEEAAEHPVKLGAESGLWAGARAATAAGWR